MGKIPIATRMFYSLYSVQRVRLWALDLGTYLHGGFQMIKFRLLRTVGLSMVIAMLAVLLIVFTVSAQTVAYATSSHASPAAGCSSVPVTNIVISPTTHKAIYKPNKIAVKVSTTLSFCITNKTTKTQNVTFQGSTLASIPAKQTAGIRCNRPNTSTFGLTSNPKAKLSITCT